MTMKIAVLLQFFVVMSQWNDPYDLDVLKIKIALTYKFYFIYQPKY